MFEGELEGAELNGDLCHVSSLEPRRVRLGLAFDEHQHRASRHVVVAVHEVALQPSYTISLAFKLIFKQIYVVFYIYVESRSAGNNDIDNFDEDNILMVKVPLKICWT